MLVGVTCLSMENPLILYGITASIVLVVCSYEIKHQRVEQSQVFSDPTHVEVTALVPKLNKWSLVMVHEMK